LYYALAFVGAFFATFVAFRFIFDIYRSRRLKYFGYYCFVVGLISIALYAYLG